ncbi:MAG: ABC transporter permease [Mesorhizobium sp.]|nr:MAG: ABC transporter permease [Mesorhizobium sp.]
MLSMPELSQLALEPPGRGGVLLAGLLASIYIAAGAYSLGLAIGALGACGKIYGGRVLRDLLECYTTLVRAVPELVFILLLYYAGTDALNRLLGAAGYGPVDINGLATGIAVLGINQGAYATEVIRGAIKAIPYGQIEAARAFGMGPVKIFRRITFPAMLPHALPGLANLWLVATKDTALLAVVGFLELTLAARQAASTTKYYFTFYFAAVVLYLTVSVISNIVIKLLELRYRRGMTEPV